MLETNPKRGSFSFLVKPKCFSVCVQVNCGLPPFMPVGLSSIHGCTHLSSPNSKAVTMTPRSNKNKCGKARRPKILDHNP